jgi:hypothetical protein
MRLSDLVTADGQASRLARSMLGRTIKVRGYLAPSLDGFEFALSESSPAACQLCGSIHDPGTTIAIRWSSPANPLPAFEPVHVEGRLVVDEDAAIVRIVDARVQAV